MLDYFKLFFASVHSLPPALRYVFVFLFFTTAVVVAVAFKRWLENRQQTKETDLWTCVPVSLAVAQFVMWGMWATASFYAVYVLDPAVARPAQLQSPAGGATAAAAPAQATRSHSRWRREAHATTPVATKRTVALPEAQVGRSSDAVLAGEVVPGHKPPAKARHGSKQASTPPVLADRPVARQDNPDLVPPPTQHAQGNLTAEADSVAPAPPPQAKSEPPAEPADGLVQGAGHQDPVPAAPAKKLKRKKHRTTTVTGDAATQAPLRQQPRPDADPQPAAAATIKPQSDPPMAVQPVPGDPQSRTPRAHPRTAGHAAPPKAEADATVGAAPVGTTVTPEAPPAQPAPAQAP